MNTVPKYRLYRDGMEKVWCLECWVGSKVTVTKYTEVPELSPHSSQADYVARKMILAEEFDAKKRAYREIVQRPVVISIVRENNQIIGIFTA